MLTGVSRASDKHFTRQGNSRLYHSSHPKHGIQKQAGRGEGLPVVGRQPLFCGREGHFTRLRIRRKSFDPSQFFDSGSRVHNSLAPTLAEGGAGLLSGPVGRLEGKNALGHAAGPGVCGFGPGIRLSLEMLKRTQSNWMCPVSRKQAAFVLLVKWRTPCTISRSYRFDSRWQAGWQLFSAN